MSVEIIARPPFCEDWTEISISGDSEDPIQQIIVGRLVALDYDVMIDENGEMIPWEDC